MVCRQQQQVQAFQLSSGRSQRDIDLYLRSPHVIADLLRVLRPLHRVPDRR